MKNDRAPEAGFTNPGGARPAYCHLVVFGKYIPRYPPAVSEVKRIVRAGTDRPASFTFGTLLSRVHIHFSMVGDAMLEK
jgi:hypothetical protein